jgi:excisionase family DNA binding protein
LNDERCYSSGKEVAKRLEISLITLKHWIYQGRIRAVKTVGRRYGIPESEVLRVIGKQPVARNRSHWEMVAGPVGFGPK